MVNSGHCCSTGSEARYFGFVPGYSAPCSEKFQAGSSEFPVEFLHQRLSTLVLYCTPWRVRTIRDFWHWFRFGCVIMGLVLMLICAASGKPLISIQQANPKLDDISQILLDLQTVIGTPSMHLKLCPAGAAGLASKRC